MMTTLPLIFGNHLWKVWIMVCVGLLEDEVNLRSEIAEFIRSENYEVIEAGTISDFKLLIPSIQIAIIDIGLPDGSGFDVAGLLHKSSPNIGIIMLTARGSIDDKIKGLKRGADKYLVKPIDFDELSAHLFSMSRRIMPRSWQLHLIHNQISDPQGNRDDLSPYEMILLNLLAKHKGKIVARSQIAQSFGSDWLDFDQRKLDQLVSRLRKRWKSVTNQQLPVKTAHGQGYIFCEDIDIV